MAEWWGADTKANTYVVQHDLSSSSLTIKCRIDGAPRNQRTMPRYLFYSIPFIVMLCCVVCSMFTCDLITCRSDGTHNQPQGHCPFFLRLRCCCCVFRLRFVFPSYWILFLFNSFYGWCGESARDVIARIAGILVYLLDILCVVVGAAKWCMVDRFYVCIGSAIIRIARKSTQLSKRCPGQSHIKRTLKPKPTYEQKDSLSLVENTFRFLLLLLLLEG